jgi:outer membrane lipoprotein-sorting protein
MKRISLTLAFVAALLAAASFSGPAASANGELDQILANMQQKARGLQTIYARLRQEKRHGQIGGREISSGELFFKHAGPGNDMVRINYDRPEGQVAAVLGNQIILYQAKINQVILTTRAAQASGNQELGFIATPYSSVPQLKSRYNIAYKGEDGGAALLELTPKAKSSVQKLNLWVDRGLWLPTKYQVFEQNGNVTTFTLSDIKPNLKMGNNQFKVNWPKGTKEIRK